MTGSPKSSGGHPASTDGTESRSSLKAGEGRRFSVRADVTPTRLGESHPHEYKGAITVYLNLLKSNKADSPSAPLVEASPPLEGGSARGVPRNAELPRKDDGEFYDAQAPATEEQMAVLRRLADDPSRHASGCRCQTEKARRVCEAFRYGGA
jgi:hypothetical protein